MCIRYYTHNRYMVEANKHKDGNVYIHPAYIVHPRQKEPHKITEHAKHFIHTKCEHV